MTKIYDTLTSAAMRRVLEMARRYDMDTNKQLDNEDFKAIQRVQEFIKPLEAILKIELKKLSDVMEEAAEAMEEEEAAR
jgi:hypothetical protein